MEYKLIKNVLLHLTDRCNLSCKHCYITSYSGSQFSLDDLKQVNYLVSRLDKPLDITGGDPFMHKDVEDYLHLCFDMSLNVSSIFTNGTLLSHHEQLLNSMYLYNKDTIFFISLDGYKESHDVFRGPNSFDKALAGAKLLRDIGFKVYINTILHNRITEVDLKNLYHEIKINSFGRWRVDTPFNAGNWLNSKDNFDLDFEIAFKYFNLILEMSLQENMPFELELNHTLKFLDNQFYYMDKYSLDDPVCPCKTLAIWPNGDITWCQDLYGQQFIIGNIYDDVDFIYQRYVPFKERTINDMLQCVSECSGCGYIEYCGVGCRANAILQGGEYFNKDDELCYLFNSGLHKTIAKTIIDHQKHIVGN